MSKALKANRKLERFLFDGQMQDSSSCRNPQLITNRHPQVNLDNCTIIGYLSDDPETGEEVFTPNPDLEINRGKLVEITSYRKEDAETGDIIFVGDIKTVKPD